MLSPQDGKWSKEDEEASIKRGDSKSPPQQIHGNTVSILAINALLKFGGQAIIQVGLLWIPHSVEAGLFVSNLCGVAKLFFLNRAFCNSFALEALLPTRR